MALSDLLAGLRGVGEGVSMGLTRYPAARAIQAARGLQGEPISYEEALKIVREQEAQAEQETPVATYGGRVVGTLLTTPGAAVGKTLGKTILGAGARGAVQGGVSGFTAQEGMENVGRDVTLGALTGGVLSGAGAGLSKGLIESTRKTMLNKLDSEIAEGVSTLKNTSPQSVQQFDAKLGDLSKKLRKSKAEVTKMIGLDAVEGLSVNKQKMLYAAITPEDEDIAYAQYLLQNGKAIRNKIASQSPEKLSSHGPTRDYLRSSLKQDITGAISRTASEFIPGAITGGALGAAGGALHPDYDALTGAQLGAALGGGLQAKAAIGQLVPKILPAIGAYLPTSAGETAGRLATRAIVPQALAPVEKSEVRQAAQPEAMPQDQLQQLLDEFEAASNEPTTTPTAPSKPGKFNYSNEYGVPEELLKGVHRTESGFGAQMKSKAGAEGHFQFMPETAKEYGLKNPYDFEESKKAAARKLADLHKQYGNWEEALQAYNLGQGNLKKVFAGQKQMPKETVEYVGKVKGYSSDYLKQLNSEFDAAP